LIRGIFYLGPETIMPLASIIAAILGFLLIAWRTIWKYIKRGFYRITKRSPEVLEEEETSGQDVTDDSQEEMHSL
jgi:hypothetical protein